MTLEQLLRSRSRKYLLFARGILILLMISWMYVIFSFSAQNATDSTAASDKAIQVLDQIVEITTGNKVNLEFNEQYRTYVEFGVRKCAHMFIYFILCITIMLFLFTFDRIPMLVRMLLALFSSFLYACTDEFHQSFVAGRGPSFRDVLIDSTGALFGIIMSLIIYCVIYTIYNKHQLKKMNNYHVELSEEEKRNRPRHAKE